MHGGVIVSTCACPCACPQNPTLLSLGRSLLERAGGAEELYGRKLLVYWHSCTPAEQLPAFEQLRYLHPGVLPNTGVW